VILFMILHSESWMNIRRFRALHAGGASYAEIGRECGVDWRTVKKNLAEDAPSVPPAAPQRAGSQPKVITEFVGVIEAWLCADITLKGSVIHERLVAEHGFTGHYQCVKMFLAEARPRIAADLAVEDENPLTGLHRQFEVAPGAQAQVDWGDESDLLGHVGILLNSVEQDGTPSTCMCVRVKMKRGRRRLLPNGTSGHDAFL
jgi:hypothetical protein